MIKLWFGEKSPIINEYLSYLLSICSKRPGRVEVVLFSRFSIELSCIAERLAISSFIGGNERLCLWLIGCNCTRGCLRSRLCCDSSFSISCHIVRYFERFSMSSKGLSSRLFMTPLPFSTFAPIPSTLFRIVCCSSWMNIDDDPFRLGPSPALLLRLSPPSPRKECFPRRALSLSSPKRPPRFTKELGASKSPPFSSSLKNSKSRFSFSASIVALALIVGNYTLFSFTTNIGTFQSRFSSSQKLYCVIFCTSCGLSITFIT